jgi:hypothetical protein
MSCADYSQAIQELVDGTLDEGGRLRLEAHLAGCADCRALAADLRQIRRSASGLEPLAPPAGVWPRLADRLRADAASSAPSRGRPTMSMGGLWLAVAATLVVTIGATLFLLLRTDPGPEPLAPDTAAGTAATTPGNTEVEDLVESVEADLKLAEQHYEAALANLERMSQGGDDRIDATVAQTLRQNVALVDRAIADSRTALQGDPQNVPARESLFEALRRKVGLLQDTISLVNEMRKGNQAGAAEIVEGLKKS